MLPEVCRTKDFVFCTQREAEKYATNLSLIGELRDHLALWRSHLTDVIVLVRRTIQEIDDRTENNPVHVFESVKALVAETSFTEHLKRDEAVAVLRVLAFDAPSSEKLAKLGDLADQASQMHEGLVHTSLLFEAFAQLTPSDPADICHAAGPCFSSLRAVYFCCGNLGSRFPFRFGSVIKSVLNTTTNAIAAVCKSALPNYVSDTITYKQCRRQLVDCQNAIVATQEAYCDLLSAVLTDGQMPEAVLCSVADLDWHFSRIVLLLEALDALHNHAELRGTEVFEKFNVPWEQGSAATDLVAAISRLQRSRLISTSVITNRISKKTLMLQPTELTSAAKPFRMLSSVFLFDPPTLCLSGGGAEPALLRGLEKAFASAFTAGTRIEHFEDSSQGSILVLRSGGSTEPKQMAAMIAVLDRFEADGWGIVDSHACADHDKTKYVFLLERL